MSQVSKIDECLNFHNYAVARDPASNTQANQTTKAALLSTILEALPEKQEGSWCCHPDEDDWHHIAPEDKVKDTHSECSIHEFAGGSTGDTSFNAAIDEVKEQIKRVFGVEG